MDEELDQIGRECIEINRYPKWIITQLKEECQLIDEQNHQNTATNINSNTVTATTHDMLVLPHKDEKAEKLIKPLLNRWMHYFITNEICLFPDN